MSPRQFDAKDKAHLKNENRMKVQPAEGILERAEARRDEVCVDLGCGIGYLSAPLALRCQAVVAVDSQNEMLTTLWSSLSEFARSNVYPVQAQVDRLPFFAPSFDHVFLVNVLHEVEDRDRLAEEVERVLRPGGRMTVVDFHKKPTSFGPPVEERLTAEEAEACFSSMRLEKKHSLDEFYQLEMVHL